MVNSYECDAVLRDGTSIIIRRVESDDRSRLRCLFERMSKESIRHRFFGAKSQLTDEDLAYTADPAQVALAAVAMRQGEEVILGVARYQPMAGLQPRTAEVAF